MAFGLRRKKKGAQNGANDNPSQNKKGITGFEVQFLKDGRWVIDMILPDELEAAAQAKSLLDKNEEYEAARVLTLRKRLDGNRAEEESLLLEQKEKTKAYRLRGEATDGGICHKASDFANFESRLAIYGMFRDYLEDVQITVTELLHIPTFLRKLEDGGGLLSAAIFQRSKAQAEILKMPQKAREIELVTMLAEWKKQGKDMMTERRHITNFEASKVKEIYQEVRAKRGEDNLEHGIRSHICVSLMGCNGLWHKLETILGWLEYADDAPILYELADDFVADILMSAETIQTLFGNQPNMGAFIKVLGDILLGNYKGKEDESGRKGVELNENLFHIQNLMTSGRAPQCRGVFIERLTTEMESDKDLDRHNPDNENSYLKEVIKQITDNDDKLLGGDRTKAAIKRRRRIIRQGQLRAMGMDDAADALG